MSRSGVLAYVTNAAGAPEVRIQSGADAWPRTIGGAAEQDRPKGPYAVRLSPDGERVAVEEYGSNHLIWIYPIAGGTPVRLDSETTDQHGPSWSPDGNWIAYRLLKNGSWEIVKAPLGGGAVVRLDDAAPGGAPTDWSPTGEWIAHFLPDGLHLISPDGASKRVLKVAQGWLRFTRDGTRLILVRRGANRQSELTTWDVAADREVKTIALPLASATDIQGSPFRPTTAASFWPPACRRRTSGSSSSSSRRPHCGRGCSEDSFSVGDGDPALQSGLIGEASCAEVPGILRRSSCSS